MKLFGLLFIIAIYICLVMIECRLSDLNKRIIELRHDLIFSACKNE